MAIGLLHRMKTFQFVFVLNTFTNLLAPFKNVSVQLQSAHVDLAVAADFIASLKEMLAEKEVVAFTGVWEAAAQMCMEMGFSVPLRPTRERRQVRLPNFDSSSTEASGFRPTLHSGDDFRDNLFLPLIHCLREELDARFGEESLDQLRTIAVCLPSSQTFLDFLDYEKLRVMCEKFGLDAVEMRDTELSTARRYLCDKHKTNPLLSLCDVLQFLNIELFPNLHRIVKILATLPVTTANNERAFSTMRRIKTHLRASMSDQRLNSLALISTEKDIALEIPMHVLVQSFYELKNRARR